MLRPYEGAIRALAVACAQAVAVDGATHGRSRFGGLPSGFEGSDWPRTPEGLPMAFVGQIDLREVGEALPMSARGLVQLFYDTDAWRSGHSAGDEAYWRCLHHLGPGDEPMPVPPGLRIDPWAPRSENSPATWPLGPLRFVLDESVPYDALQRMGVDPSEAERDAFADLIGVDAPRHQVLGVPRGVQFDPTDPREKTSDGGRRRLLWQIGSDADAGFMWNDAGTLYLLVGSEGFDSGRVENAWVSVQS